MDQGGSMEEVLPGVWYWSAEFDRDRTPLTPIAPVQCFYLEESKALIDPMIPDEGMEWFDGREPERVLLTSGRHIRHSERFVERFDCSVHCHSSSVHDGRLGPSTLVLPLGEWDVPEQIPVEPFEHGEIVLPGITVHEIGELVSSDVALHMDHGAGAVAFGDSLVRLPAAMGGGISFIPGFFMKASRPDLEISDEFVKEVDDRIRGVGLPPLIRLVEEREFEAILFTHGEPLLTGGKEALASFVEAENAKAG